VSTHPIRAVRPRRTEIPFGAGSVEVVAGAGRRRRAAQSGPPDRGGPGQAAQDAIHATWGASWPAHRERETAELVLTDLARAAVRAGDVEWACGYAAEVAEIARQGSGLLTSGLRRLEAQLAHYARAPVVGDLKARLAAVA
jgi:hypothetical protein